jgi:hypothetical protein
MCIRFQPGTSSPHTDTWLRYLVVAPPDASLRRQVAEARALRWFTWDELETVDLDPGLRRALRAARAVMLAPNTEEESDR